MATKPRHLKSEMQLWVMDNRKRLGVTSADLANWTGLDEDTARSWESRGRPGEDALRILEQRFGRPAPREADQAAGQDALVVALREQTAAITALAEAIEKDRDARRDFELGLLAGVRDLLAGFRAATPEGDPERRHREGAGQ